MHNIITVEFVLICLKQIPDDWDNRVQYTSPSLLLTDRSWGGMWGNYAALMDDDIGYIPVAGKVTTWRFYARATGDKPAPVGFQIYRRDGAVGTRK